MADYHPLAVIALGGHALSAADPRDIVAERDTIQALESTFHALVAQGYRLLVVHGNGPQVGRDVSDDEDLQALDVLTARTQGELGYLLAQSLPEPNVGLLTRVQVSGATTPTKPIGPLLKKKPALPSTCVGGRWRVLVASPRPQRVLEQRAIETLLETHHVVAGGGGGIPLDSRGNPVLGVVDKDWTAALLAIHLAADLLVFATNVAGVYRSVDDPEDAFLQRITTREADALLAIEGWGRGSMAPKLESASRYAEATGSTAYICRSDSIAAALDGATGTAVQV